MTKLELEPVETEAPNAAQTVNADAHTPFPRHPRMNASQAEREKRALRFPLNIRMKLLTIAPQFYMEYPSGKTAAYLKQRAFKLKEDIKVFEDDSQKRLLHSIKADRILDFGATYHFHSAQQGIMGYTKQHGIKSMWRTHFDIGSDDGILYSIQQENPIIEVVESLLSMVPLLGPILTIFSGYVLNPTYVVKTVDDRPVARMTRKPAFFEGKFELRKEADLSPEQQELIILSMLTLLLMQRGDD